MSIIIINKTIIAVMIFMAACSSGRMCILALAEKPQYISRMEEFLSGKASVNEANDIADEIQAEIQKNPANEANYAALAFIYDYAGSYGKAVEALRTEIKYTPEKSEWDIIYGNLAREYLNLGRADEARKPALKSLKFNPKNINSHMSLLKCYILKGEYKKAALELKVMSALDKEMDFYYEIYTCCFDKFKNKNDIIELFRESVKVNPDNPLSHRALGTAIRDLSHDDMEKNLSIVMESFNKALELNKNYIPTYISIANTYLYLGFKTNKKAYFEDSLVWINKAHKLDPRNLKVAYSMGNIFLAMDEYDKGIEKLEYAFNNGGASDKDTIMLLAAAYNNQAYSYYETGKNIDRGLKMIDKAIMLDPDNGLILSTKAELLYKKKRFKDAYTCIQKAMVLAPDEPGMREEFENIEKAAKALK
jgi:tetratricopeptide (TPR) repeat protein